MDISGNIDLHLWWVAIGSGIKWPSLQIPF